MILILLLLLLPPPHSFSSLFLFFLPPLSLSISLSFFFFNDTATTEIYTLSLHDALPIWPCCCMNPKPFSRGLPLKSPRKWKRSEEHTSELQSPGDLVCRLLLEKKKK